MPLHSAARSAMRAAGWAALRMVPPRRIAVVHGWPDSEGNALEVLRGLARRYRGEVVWLLNDPDYVPTPPVEHDLAGVRRVRKDSFEGWRAAVTAEVVFFTHGLYTAVDPPDDRLVVNLWHGDGPKVANDTHLVRSTVAVAGTRLWGAARPDRFGLPRDAVAVVGNPRIDELLEPVPHDVLRQLGIDPDRPLVLWLPTYRAASGPRQREWGDAATLTSAGSMDEIVRACRDAADRLGVQVVLKPHPLDADRFESMPLKVLTQSELDRSGTSLYRLLGRAAAVVSDVSSVWTDYLSLDRPVAFYLPDLEEMQARRGFNVDDLAPLLPGPRIVTPDDMVAFLHGVAVGDPALLPSRHPAYDVIGPAPVGAATDRLLDWLDDFQQRRGRRRLFDNDGVEGQKPSPSQG